MSSLKFQRRSIVGSLLGIALLVGIAWWWARPAAIRREAGLNILLVTVDTLRMDAVGAYGRAGDPTPWIDKLAQSGVRFSQAHAHNVTTLPSHANILLGRLPTDHGVRDNAGFRVPASAATLATLLQKNGYRTGAFVSAFPLDSRFGLDRGFDTYDDRVGDGPRPAFLVQERRGEETVARARMWLQQQRDGPWFCWVHLYEPHYPYEPPEPFAARWAGDPYLGEVAAADAAIGALLGPLLQSDAAARTMIIVTSDHGESLGEHGEATHGIFAYEPTLSVPLVIYQPRILRPRVVEAHAQHVDLLPTILDALALPALDGLAGRSLLPAMIGSREQSVPPVYFEALSGALNRGWAPLFGVIRDGFKFIDLPVPELYDVRADPRETRNLAPSEPSRVAALRGVLDGFREEAAPAERRSEPADVRDRLRSLGYIAATAPPRDSFTEEDDPKRLIELDGRLQEIVAAYLRGDLAGALARARELVDRRPSMGLAWMHLAHLEREAGNLGAAVSALEYAVRLSPNDPDLLTLLAAYLTEAGRAGDAVVLLDGPARAPDADLEVLTTRALALARAGRVDDALRTLARARQREPSDATLLLHVGTVQLGADRRREARDAFEEALRIDPTLARAHSSLGVLALEDGQAERAAEHWKAATSLDPREYGRVLGVCIGLDRQGRRTAARPCFEFFAAHAPPSRYARELERVRMWLAAAR